MLDLAISVGSCALVLCAWWVLIIIHEQFVKLYKKHRRAH